MIRTRTLLFAAAAFAAASAGCSRHRSGAWQGYLEGDFVYVSSPLAGRLDHLAVAKGDRIAKGAPLFALERASEEAALSQASQESDAMDAQLADIRKGSRPEEIAALEARLGQARAAAELSGLDLAREQALFNSGAVAASDLDKARLSDLSNRRAVDEDEAKLETARLGGRSDSVAAARSAARASADARARAKWAVDQKAQSSPCAALVYDTLYREGEYVPAGSPVVSLLPAANIKVRFFVSEPDFAGIRAGDRVSVRVTDGSAPLEARITYLSPRPEYTPPVLYNRDNRAKLVFMVEASFAPEVAANLHPGQPVDVESGAR